MHKDDWRRSPTGVRISTELGERVGHLRWRFGCELHRVWFGDHRSGWSGINLYLYFFWWGWRACIIRWKLPVRAPIAAAVTLREQINAAHGARWAAHDAEMAAQEAETRALVELQTKMIREHTRRLECTGEDVDSEPKAEDPAGD